MKAHRSAVSSAVLGVSIIVLLIIVAAAGFYIGSAGVTPVTITQTGPTTTVTVTGAASTVTTPGNGGTATNTGSAVTVTSSGNPTTATPSGVANPCTDNATLYDAAKKEGTVYYYSSQTVAELTVLQARFEAACPGIAMQFQNINGGPLTAQIQSEFTSGKHIGDVVQGPIDTAVAFQANGWLDYYVPPNPANIPSSYLQPTGYFTGERAPYYIIAYNPKLVTDSSQLPKSWMDLTNPKWTGKIAIADPYLSNFVLAWYAAMKQPLGANWTAFVNGIHALHPLLQPNNDLAAAAIANGQASIGITLTSSMFPLLQSNASIAPLAVGPIVSLPNGVFLLKGAPHPNAARLFIAWTATLPTLQFYASYGDPTSNGLAPSAYGSLVPLAKYQTSPVQNATAVQQQMGLPWTQ